MRIFLFLILFLPLFSCKSQSSSNAEKCDDYLNERSGNAKDSFLIFLSASKFKTATEYLIREKKIPLDADNKLLFANDSNLSRESSYFLYRLNDFSGNKYGSELMDELLKAYQATQESRKRDCLDKLVEAEFDYLAFYSKKDSLSRVDNINKIEKIISEFPASLRLKYIYAKMNLDFGNVKAAKKEFDMLLKEGYYEKPIMDMLFFYYLNHEVAKDTLDYYIKLFSEKFPFECNIGKVFYEVDSSEYYLQNCKKCLESRLEGDSVVGKVGLLKLNLIKRNFSEVENLYTAFRENNPKLNPDNRKIWERGEYFDSFLQSLFLQKKYKQMYVFAIRDLGYNTKVNIESNSDFKELIRKYYNEYFGDDSFEKFYNKEFSFVKKDFAA